MEEEEMMKGVQDETRGRRECDRNKKKGKSRKWKELEVKIEDE